MTRMAIIVGLAGAVIGALLTWFLIAQPRVALAEQARDDARQAETAAAKSLEVCRGTASDTQAALDNLREQTRLRAQQAQIAMDAAVQANRATQDAVMRILAESTPEGVDACLAASAAFDAELRKERGL